MGEPIQPEEVISPGGFLKPAVYDKLKQAALYYLPAISTLYFTLGTIWGFPSIEQVVGSIAAINVFISAIVGVSKKRYNESDAKFDGNLVVIPRANGGITYSIEPTGDLAELQHKEEMTLKVRPAEGPEIIVDDED